MEIRQIKGESAVEFSKRAAYLNQYIVTRLDENNVLLNDKMHNAVPLTAEQMADVKRYWEKYFPPYLDVVAYDHFAVYNAYVADKSQLKYYIPDSLFYAFVDEYLTNPKRSAPVDDKNLYDLLFCGVSRPKTIARKIEDVYIDRDYRPIDFDEFVRLCESYDEVVVKSSIYSFGGHGVFFWSKYRDSVEDLKKVLFSESGIVKNARSVKQFIVQEPLVQHEALSAINASSINTVRVMTLMKDGQAIPLSSVLRMGINGSRVDNCSSGGIVCGITDDGRLKDCAYDKKANRYERHPDGFEFAGYEIPGFAECVNLAKKLAYRFCGQSRLISWDFAIGKDGHPILIEMNISYGELDFHQLCNGPILGEYTDEILEEVATKSFTYTKLLESYKE